jgi:hypothetical protein
MPFTPSSTRSAACPVGRPVCIISVKLPVIVISTVMPYGFSALNWSTSAVR